MDGTLISVIVPIYKVEKYLNKCVNSIINQTYKNIEILLIDDGSPDNCPALCDELAGKDSRITVVHKQNGGLSSARNAGLQVASGDYICFVDSDDFIDPKTFELAIEKIQADNTDMVIFNMQYCDEFGAPIDGGGGDASSLKEIWSEDDFWRYYFAGYLVLCVVSWNKLYKKELFDNVRFAEGRLHEDQFIIHQIVSQCRSISFMDTRLYWYVQRTGSIMANRNHQNDIDFSLAYLDRIDYFLTKNRMIPAVEAFLTVEKVERGLRKNIKDFNERQNKDYSVVSRRLDTSYDKLKKSDLRLKQKARIFLRFRMNPLYKFAVKVLKNSNKFK